MCTTTGRGVGAGAACGRGAGFAFAICGALLFALFTFISLLPGLLLRFSTLTRFSPPLCASPAIALDGISVRPQIKVPAINIFLALRAILLFEKIENMFFFSSFFTDFFIIVSFKRFNNVFLSLFLVSAKI